MSDRYAASVSFGKDSTAMVLGIIERGMPLDKVIFYDTGAEFQAVYDVRDKVVPIIESYGAEYVEMHPPRPFFYDMLEKPVKHRDGTVSNGYGWCGGPCRWGTAYKISTIDKINDGSVLYVGIASDEIGRIKRERAEYKRLPLVDWGMTEKDCLEFCKARGIEWMEGEVDLYGVLNRVSCWCCRNKNLKELRAIRENLPEYWDKLTELEEKIGEPMKSRWLNELSEKWD